ncbi:MAG: SIMPL domain-containing protein [Methanomicrobiaceae archaeon]|nr:SIMPL domain-containing protein [Methanomicrobiaceae archaeon]
MSIKKIILVSVMLVLIAAIAGTASAADSSEDKTISVSGTGKVTSAPDTVIISIAVETENTDAYQAQQQNAEKMNAVVNSLKAIGLTDDEIETSGYNIYSYTSGDDSVFGSKKKIYKVTNTIKVTSSKVDMAGEIIDNAVSAGANNINYISFTLSDEKSNQLRSQALDAAVSQAASDAKSVASALGVTVMGVKSVNVGASYTPVRYDSGYNEIAMYKTADAAGSAVPTAVQPGDVDVTASVSIVYLIH